MSDNRPINSSTQDPSLVQDQGLSPRRVGYIGLGIMGSAMAANLLQAGFELTVWNRTAGKAAPLLEQGARWADSPAAVAQNGVEVVCINVTDTADVREVLHGKEGILAGAKAGLIVIDHSTIDPQATRQMAIEARQAGVTFLDAPVSGGDVGARDGTLSVMVGGDERAFERCLPVFKAVGRTITHLGPAGMGQVCKACNQVAVAMNLLGVCEALALARQSGLDMERMIQVVTGGAGGSWQLANLGPRIVAGDMKPGFMIELMLKDLAIVMQAGQSLGLPMEGTRVAREALVAAASLSPDAPRQGTQAMARAIAVKGGFDFGDPD